MTPSDRIVYGAVCTWIGTPAQMGTTPTQIPLPCCPHCGGMLYEISRGAWNAGVAEHAQVAADPLYPSFVEWVRGRRCRSKGPAGAPDVWVELRAEYDAERARSVN